MVIFHSYVSLPEGTFSGWKVLDLNRGKHGWQMLAVSGIPILYPSRQINQRWTFSTNVVFRFSYEGYGLTSGETSGKVGCQGQKLLENTCALRITIYIYIICI